jgi:hypothetical protein
MLRDRQEVNDVMHFHRDRPTARAAVLGKMITLGGSPWTDN